MESIYIHVPFCRGRCSYCDFYFVTSHKQVDEFVAAVCHEIELRASATDRGTGVQTLYFGGGTPSRLSTDQLERILSAVSRYYGTSRLEEITIEVNPEDPDAGYLQRLLALGFTRLSVGLQSLNDADLEFMHRAHSAEQAREFVDLALQTGFHSLSLDLIFGLPGMGESKWREALEYAVSSGVQHVSLYGLTIEPGTLLGKWVRSGNVIPPPEEQLEAQFRLAHDLMTGHGFEHYEISNFALPGHQSRHNRSYWNHTSYLGFGPAAHSFLRTDPGRRWENVRSLRRYLQQLDAGELPVSNVEELDPERLMQEYVFLGLRTDRGISTGALREEYGHEFSTEGLDILSELADSGRLIREGDRLRLTMDGFLVADSITSALLTTGAIRSMP